MSKVIITIMDAEHNPRITFTIPVQFKDVDGSYEATFKIPQFVQLQPGEYLHYRVVM